MRPWRRENVDCPAVGAHVYALPGHTSTVAMKAAPVPELDICIGCNEQGTTKVNRIVTSKAANMCSELPVNIHEYCTTVGCVVEAESRLNDCGRIASYCSNIRGATRVSIDNPTAIHLCHAAIDNMILR